MDWQDESPYKPPKATLLDDEAYTEKPQYKLYLPKSVGLATFFGSPIAGGIILAINYLRLGEPAHAFKSVALTVVATFALAAVLWNVPDIPFLNIGSTIIQLLIMLKLATFLQGEKTDLHIDAGGSIASGWAAFGIGILVTVAILVVVFVPIILLELDI